MATARRLILNDSCQKQDVPDNTPDQKERPIMAATTSKNLTTVPALPQIGDVIDADKLGDDILRSAAAADTNTKKIINGGASAKFQPRAWSYGGSID